MRAKAFCSCMVRMKLLADKLPMQQPVSYSERCLVTVLANASPSYPDWPVRYLPAFSNTRRSLASGNRNIDSPVAE